MDVGVNPNPSPMPLLLSATSPKHKPSIDHVGWDHTETPGIISDAETQSFGELFSYFHLEVTKRLKGKTGKYGE